MPPAPPTASRAAAPAAPTPPLRLPLALVLAPPWPRAVVPPPCPRAVVPRPRAVMPPPWPRAVVPCPALACWAPAPVAPWRPLRRRRLHAQPATRRQPVHRRRLRCGLPAPGCCSLAFRPTAAAAAVATAAARPTAFLLLLELLLPLLFSLRRASQTSNMCNASCTSRHAALSYRDWLARRIWKSVIQQLCWPQ